MYKGKLVQTEDCTPTWSQVVELHIRAIEHCGAESGKTEVRRMARLADERNELIMEVAKLNRMIVELQDGKK